MKINKALVGITVLSIFFTGCSSYQVKNTDVSMPDAATKQKTMTKVQNDIDEIIDRDYEYVLNNLGEPNVTTSLIESSEIDSVESIDDIKALGDINLLYFKNIADDSTDKSALLLQLKDDVVSKVQSIDYTYDDIPLEINKSQVAINCYSNSDTLDEEEINDEKLLELEGIDFSKFEQIIENKQWAYDAYVFDDSNKSIKIYELSNEGKLLTIFTDEEKISNIEILDSSENIITVIKNIVLGS